MKILMVTPSYKSRSRPLMKTRSLERTPPKKKLDLRPCPNCKECVDNNDNDNDGMILSVFEDLIYAV